MKIFSIFPCQMLIFQVLHYSVLLYSFLSLFLKYYQTQSPKFLLDDKVFKYPGIHEAIFIINLADVSKEFFFHSFRNTVAGNFDLQYGNGDTYSFLFISVIQ